MANDYTPPNIPRDNNPADPLADPQGNTVGQGRVSVLRNRDDLPALPGQRKQPLSAGSNNANRLRLKSVKQGYEQEPEAPPPPPRQPDYQEFERRRQRRRRDAEDLRGPGCGCRVIGFVLSLILVGIIVGIIYLLINRPPQIVNPIKDWLNQDLAAITYSDSDQETALFNLNSQISQFGTGQNVLVLSQLDLNVLLNRDAERASLNAALTDNQLKLYVDSDPEGEKPLWLVAKFEVDPENPEDLRLAGVGTERVTTPQFFNDAILDIILSTSNFVTDTEANSILDFAINLPSNVKIQSVDIKDQQVLITLEVTTGLENLFE